MGRLSASQRLADIGVRLLYLGGAIAMTWVMALRYRALREAITRTFEFSTARWLPFIGAAVLIGILIGLGLRPPRAWGGYRVGVALALGLPPALLLATVPLYVSGRWVPPSWVTTITGAGGNDGGQAALAAMIGLAIVAGLTSREAEEPDR